MLRLVQIISVLNYMFCIIEDLYDVLYVFFNFWLITNIFCLLYFQKEKGSFDFMFHSIFLGTFKESFLYFLKTFCRWK